MAIRAETLGSPQRAEPPRGLGARRWPVRWIAFAQACTGVMGLSWLLMWWSAR